jgi:hypothetical protein
MLIIGTIFSVLYGSGEQLQVSECLVAVWSVISENHPPPPPQRLGSCVLLTANKSLERNQIQSNKMLEQQ